MYTLAYSNIYNCAIVSHVLSPFASKKIDISVVSFLLLPGLQYILQTSIYIRTYTGADVGGCEMGGWVSVPLV